LYISQIVTGGGGSSTLSVLVSVFVGVVTGGVTVVTGAGGWTGATGVPSGLFVYGSGAGATGAGAIGVGVGATGVSVGNGVTAGATHATGAIGVCCAFTCQTASATDSAGFFFLSSRAC